MGGDWKIFMDNDRNSAENKEACQIHSLTESCNHQNLIKSYITPKLKVLHHIKTSEAV